MRRVLAIGALVFVVLAAILLGTGAKGDNDGTYKVRAIFDNASFLISGQDVKVAGAKVGSVDSLDVDKEPNGTYKAAVVLNIERAGFKDFRKDAHCAIRLQSVIGEKLVECTPTQPRVPGEPEPPPLDKIPDGHPGAGQFLLPVESTETPVDADLINNIQRRPYRERFSIILNELGTGLAARAGDLREVIRRANPALKQFDQFLHILAEQNRELGQLTKNADTVLTALAQKRKSVANFFVQSGVAAQATAEKRVDLERNFEKFPAFLRQLRPFMNRFDELSSAMAPVISDLRAAAPDLSRFLIALGPFSRSSTLALKSLGNTADVGRRALVAAKPVADQLATFTSKGRRVARNLRLLFTSIQDHQGIERFMDLLFNLALSNNGYTAFGHYLRNDLVVTICSGYVVTPTIGCSANFSSGATTSSAARAATASGPTRTVTDGLIRLLGLSKSKPAGKKDAGRELASRPGGAGGGSPDSKATPNQPTAGSPGVPAPVRPPAGQEQNKDPLLDYLLGGSQ